MQEEIENKSVTLIINGGRFSGRMLRAAIAKFLSFTGQSLERLPAEIQAANARMAEISQQKKAIYDYLKTKDVYAAWRRPGWSQQFATEHAEPLRVH